MPRTSKKKPCPRCGELGTGAYPRWVLNSVKRRYEPYYYFAHGSMIAGKWVVRWCYLGAKPILEESESPTALSPSSPPPA